MPGDQKEDEQEEDNEELTFTPQHREGVARRPVNWTGLLRINDKNYEYRGLDISLSWNGARLPQGRWSLCFWTNERPVISPRASGRFSSLEQQESFRPKTPVKTDEEEEDEEEYFSISTVCKAETMKLKKRVNFRMPEEADIIVFYCPRDEWLYIYPI